MNTELISGAFDVFFEHPDASQDEILAAIEAKGAGPKLAWRLFQFVPMACARSVYRPLGVIFQGGYILWNPETDKRSHHFLAEEPIYVEAVAEAVRRQATCGDAWHLMGIVRYSAEFRTISGLMDGGLPAGITLTESILVEYRS